MSEATLTPGTPDTPALGEPRAGDVGADPGYRVLARKYRPKNFAELIGQDALVRTLTNALKAGRIAHGFMLTGVRGVGKTTSARIIARALNCIGPDGKGGPTAEPCGVCPQCVAIAEDRNVDVIEMDAASNTGIEDVRQIIDGVRYRPAAGRYKVYIIDEVHMLSAKAFNALLKTLEEPPEHVKFVFATTEIRKVPVTVLSRCQRFDLRRVDAETLSAHFARVAAAEGAAVEPGAIKLIARAADGSVRDGLSLLDQAIADGDGKVAETSVARMLGLADRAQGFDLFDALMRGDVTAALAIAGTLHDGGADPSLVLQDLLETCHWLTRVKMAPEATADVGFGYAETERVRGAEMARKLALPALARAWQMLLKGLGELRDAPRPQQALEMVLIRLMHVADLPTPGELVRAAVERGGAPASAGPSGSGPSGGGMRASAGGAAMAIVPRTAAPEPMPERAVAPTAAVAAVPADFREMVALFGANRESILRAHLANNVHLVRYEPGRLEFHATPAAPTDLANRVSRLLAEWTGRPWAVALSREEGQPTLAQQDQAAERNQFDEARRHPLVQAALEAFPGATIESVRTLVADAPTSDLGPSPDPDAPEGDDA